MKFNRHSNPLLRLGRALVLYRSDRNIEFSFGWFTFFILFQVCLFLTAGYFLLGWLAPNTLDVQLSSPWHKYAITFLSMHMFIAFFEFFFHRYVLHTVFWRFLRGLARKHRKHHGLTHVVELKHPSPEVKTVNVRNCYPIVEPTQIESSAFPGYALVSFWGVFTPLIVGLQLIMPSMPWLIGGYMAVAWSLWLYETMHAVEHFDYEKVWKPRMEKPGLFGKMASKAYGFHLMHHSKDRLNQSISGFFGLPVPDWVLGTYYVPDELPLPDAQVDPKTQVPPKPTWIVQWLDNYFETKERLIQEADKLRARKRAGV